jgi:NAD+ synthase (glutamine-hydrolysing)
MNYGFIKTAAASPDVRVADCAFNGEKIIEYINTADKNKTQLIVFPELSITGYTCGDLFNQRQLLTNALSTLANIQKETKNAEIVAVVGLPFEHNGRLYNCAVVICGGKILGIVPKSYLPNYNEFYEMRWFAEAFDGVENVEVNGEIVPFGTNILFKCKDNADFVLALEICEDLWTAVPPSSLHALAGATVIANPSAGNEIIGKADYRRNLVSGQSARLICAYIYACAGQGESTTDVVYSAHDLICENGTVLTESKRFVNSVIYADVDVASLNGERRKNTSFRTDSDGYVTVLFSQNQVKKYELCRFVDPHPFVPSDEKRRERRCDEIISIQALGLKKRIEHIGCKNVVLGISGGLDSTQALIVTAKAFELAGLDKKGIIAVTMPCFGTTDRTYSNAVKLTEILGATLVEVNIKEAVYRHFSDIGHDENIKDLTYENSQARERTQVLMDMASKYNGFVVGTGDLSELALGWATYNGDHMSMYGVNCSIPKTLIKYLIKFIADYTENGELKTVLEDILDTPVSPELLPPNENGSIAQITEDKVGPYELHDFFLYNMMRKGFEPKKIYFLAKQAFDGVYDKATILKWLKTFYWRFFSQQFKRSCLPDGPKVGSVSLSPRGDWRMTSDACVSGWVKELEEVE